MGADIYGWVETREPGSNRWTTAFEIDDIVERRYGMFASLFGVRNGAGAVAEIGRFRAIAPGRGVPPTTSPEDRKAYEIPGTVGVGTTWVHWSELAAIDWDEEGGYYLDDGTGRISPTPLERGMRHERRGDYLIGGWKTLFERMAALGERFGPDNVRLFVWFDQE